MAPRCVWGTVLLRILSLSALLSAVARSGPSLGPMRHPTPCAAPSSNIVGCFATINHRLGGHVPCSSRGSGLGGLTKESHQHPDEVRGLGRHQGPIVARAGADRAHDVGRVGRVVELTGQLQLELICWPAQQPARALDARVRVPRTHLVFPSPASKGRQGGELVTDTGPPVGCGQAPVAWREQGMIECDLGPGLHEGNLWPRKRWTRPPRASRARMARMRSSTSCTRPALPAASIV